MVHNGNRGINAEITEFGRQDVANNGQGLELKFGFGNSPFGDFIIAGCGDAVCYMAFADGGRDEAISRLKGWWWSEASFAQDDRWGSEMASAIFGERERAIDLKVIVSGSDLRVRVWREIAKVPFGQTINYSELAHRAGNAPAVRAVGTSVGQNPLWYIIPCHRIVPKGGGTGNYAGGPERKRAILEWELRNSR